MLSEKKGINMITGRQRSYLKGLSQELKPTVFIGKAGLTENIKKEIDMALEANELVKVKIQDNCTLKAKDLANEIAAALKAEFVQAIGKKFTLYRTSIEKKRIELP